MKYILVFAFFLMPNYAYANSAQCLLLNGDEKYFCLAKENKRVADCNLIKNNDTKNQCMALVTNQKVYCDLIKDQSNKRLCRGK